MRRLVIGHKEHQVLSLTPFFADRLAVAVGCLLRESGWSPATPLVLVPMPSSPAAVRARGFDATWAMTRQTVRRLQGCGPDGGMAGVRCRRLLSQSRRVRDQAGLGAAARADNLAGSLRVTGPPPGSRSVVVIVDDVVTTGSSLAEAARALREARIPVLGAATVAATVRSGSG